MQQLNSHEAPILSLMIGTLYHTSYHTCTFNWYNYKPCLVSSSALLFFLNPRLSICPLVSRVTDLAVALGFPRTNVLQVCINRSQRPSKTFSLCVHVSRLPLRLGDVLVDDVAGETLLFFLLPHEQDTLMNEDVLFLRKRKRKHFFYSCDYEASRTP